MSKKRLCVMGSLKTNVDDMELGDWIAAHYSSTAVNTIGDFSQLGTVSDSETEHCLNPINNASLTQVLSGKVYLMKISKGVLMSLFPLYLGAFSTLIDSDLINGRLVELNGKQFKMEVPTIDDLGNLLGDIDNTIIPKYKEDLYGIANSSGVKFNTSSACFGVKELVTTSTPMVQYLMVANAGKYAQFSDLDINDANNDGLTIAQSNTATSTNTVGYFILRYVDDSRCTNIYV